MSEKRKELIPFLGFNFNLYFDLFFIYHDSIGRRNVQTEVR